jgi:glycerol-3-phosphate dehydrogenase
LSSPGNIEWHFSGVRLLSDDGFGDSSQIIRNYILEGDAPLVSIFGGKMTMARKLAESVLSWLPPIFVNMRDPWTEDALLPGGEMDDFAYFTDELVEDYPELEEDWLRGVAQRHGT